MFELGGNGEGVMDGGTVLITVFQQVGLLHNLTGIGKEFDAFFRKDNSSVGPSEYGDAHFLFQLRDGFGQTGLGDEQSFGCRGNRTSAHNFNNIAQLGKCHNIPLYGGP